MNKTVNLTKRVKTPGGRRFCAVVRSANGRIKANYVEIAGHEEYHPEGFYYIEWWDGAKRLRRSVGKNALAAEAKRHQQEQLLKATFAGLKAGLKFAENLNKIPRPSARSNWLIP
jgi:integrase/recombinase XerD